MTDQINRISESQGTPAGGKYSGGSFSGEHKRKKETHAAQSDFVEISREARKHSTGDTKKTLLEYLKELFR